MNKTKITGLANSIKSGKIAVIPTDTIYGLVGSALDQSCVEKIYNLKKRSSKKAVIVLISSLNQLNVFNIKLDKETLKVLNLLWPNPISILLPCQSNDFYYIHRGTGKIAFRLPDNKFLKGLIDITGPLIAPSANIEGKLPAQTIKQAKNYFGDNVDYYINQGKIQGHPSTIIDISKKIKILRP